MLKQAFNLTGKTSMPMNKITVIKGIAILLAPLLVTNSFAAEEQIDASDPTKIYSYAGAGLKFSEYTNGESMTELRAIGNLGFGEKDMVMFEAGYGKHDGDLVEGADDGLTNGRVRWFHLSKMDPTVQSGYRGWATQVDLQIAGELKGTDGQNVLALGYLAAYGINANWNFYLPINVVGSWDKKWGNYNGTGAGIAPMIAYSPENWWTGAYVQLWPNYTRFFSGELEGEGAGNVDLTTGGAITDTVMWAMTYQRNLDIDLRSFRRGEDTGLKNDWNMFFNIVSYF